MSFTSGARRNNDPRPWQSVAPEGKLIKGRTRWPSRTPERYHGEDTRVSNRRREFDLPSRDDVNPILAAYRAHASPAPAAEFFEWAFQAYAFGGWTTWEDASHPAHSFTLATVEQIEHARAVLSRLHRLTY